MAKGKLRLYAPAVNPSNDMKRERKLIGLIVLTAVEGLYLEGLNVRQG